jgi:hypothetical protein
MKCLSCETTIKGLTPAYQKNFGPPDEYAVLVCTECGHLMRLTPAWELRELTNADTQEVMMDDGLREALAQIGKSRLS